MIEYQKMLYARVSDVIQPFDRAEGIPQDVRSKKAILGTHVHDCIKDIIEEGFPMITGDTIGYVQSFIKWRDRIKPSFLESEMRYYNDKLMVSGCIDSLVTIEGDEKTVLIDFKTSVQESPTWPLQAHLYGYLIESSGKKISPRYLFLKLDQGGALPRVYEYKRDANTLALCMQAIEDFWDKHQDQYDKNRIIQREMGINVDGK